MQRNSGGNLEQSHFLHFKYSNTIFDSGENNKES